MTDNPNGPSSDDPAEIKADIEQTREQLADTVDALAGKLDVKAQARTKLHEAQLRASTSYQNARSSAPEPVQRALDSAQQAAQPVVAKAAEDKKRTAMIAGGVLLVLLLLRRRRHSGEG